MEELESKVEKLAVRNETLERENKILREEVALLKKWRFGRRSERIEPGQLTFGEESVPVDPEVPAEAPRKPRRKTRPGHGREPFPEHLPREDVELVLPEEDRICPCCQTPLQLIGEDVTERGHIVPARLIVRRYRRPKYACPHGHCVRSASLPDGVIDRGKFEASVYAHVTVSKYGDHVPLNRQQSILVRSGVKIAKQTMWDMLVRVDELVAQPILEQMRLELLKEGALHADETPVTLRLEGQQGTRKSYVWGWRSVAGESTSKVLIDFRENRNRAGPLNFLGDWSGALITDGYSGYNEVCRRNGIVRAGCWSHARRKFKQALDAGSKDAAEPLRRIGRLFAIERAIKARAERRKMDRDAVLELRRKVRDRTSRRGVERVHEAAEAATKKRSVLPKSKLGKALKYLETQREPLDVYLSDPRLPMHNNDQERDLRHIVTGRKNWQVFASPRGGEVACRLYSLVLSCIQNGVNPQEYIEDLLIRVSTTQASRIAELTPWGWAAARADVASRPTP